MGGIFNLTHKCQDVILIQVVFNLWDMVITQEVFLTVITVKFYQYASKFFGLTR